MISSTTRERALSEEQAEEHFMLWGTNSIELHDRIWASRGVQVVRAGLQALVAPEAPLYLLLDEKQLTVFDCAEVLKALHWRKPRVVRIRTRESRRESYQEVVRFDEEGLFLGIQRDYGVASDSLDRCWITPDRTVASRWCSALNVAEAVRELRETVRHQDRAYVAVDADSCPDVSDDEQLKKRWIERALGTSTRLSLVFDQAYQFAPGVWVHESSSVHPSARFVGPAWIGAGVQVPAESVVVGPIVLNDCAAIGDKLVPPDWQQIISPQWRLVPRIRLGQTRRVTKRAFDIAFSAFVLLCTLPLYPFVIAAICLEDGWPAFYLHQRQTLGGKPFPCFKFRTMCRDAEKLKARLVAENVCDGPQFYLENDPRLLRVGKTLRRFQFDELPQFWNVLLGHMSIVGPRPSPDRENQYCPAWREARLSVRPGLTGLWQVRRTREPLTDFQEWIRYDLQYVQYESWRMDLWIILQTIKKVIVG
jgi:lipopolysaccharide/colanic/teichoic acid biosynthesis glycosyltransferase